MKLMMKFSLCFHKISELWNLFSLVLVGNCFLCHFRQLFMYLALRKCKNDYKILKITLVQIFVWYIDTGVRALDAAFFKANSTWFNDICSKDLSTGPIYAGLNTRKLDMILQLKSVYADSNESSQNCLEWLKILEMLWSVMRLIFKTSSLTPDFFTFLM